MTRNAATVPNNWAHLVWTSDFGWFFQWTMPESRLIITAGKRVDPSFPPCDWRFLPKLGPPATGGRAAFC